MRVVWQDPLLRRRRGSESVESTRRDVERAEGRDLAIELWRCFDELRFRDALPLLSEDFEARWPNTQERIVGRDNFIGLNESYPGDSRCIVRRVEECDDAVVTITESETAILSCSQCHSSKCRTGKSSGRRSTSRRTAPRPTSGRNSRSATECPSVRIEVGFVRSPSVRLIVRCRARPRIPDTMRTRR